MKQAPILLMTYRRFSNTKFILNLLKKLNQKKIYIFNDGLKELSHKKAHDLTRNYIVDYKKKNPRIQNILPKKKLTQKKKSKYTNYFTKKKPYPKKKLALCFRLCF